MSRYQVHQKDKTQDALVEWLEARGCVYQHVGTPIDGFLCVPRWEWFRLATNGLVFITGQVQTVVAVEWKTGRRKLRPAQAKFFERWPGPKYRISTQVEAAAMLAELGAVRR